ncbi:transporter, major facilitator family [Thermotoga neapolitana DSM 4359]|uniref:Major facilitator superfamily MFS_1 n=1 Tax=Thermotoga neapolitana (strain ATCC 49049 / DSM 4359 / NBRC 107923 / NS-E) TaxID=309803 RepID=B9K9Q0_THENN|nr:Major facilitator superfamily MFS_1 [Thermotoga neapolitana DSM 4359]HBF10252.1 MFS transporter [Thermotoga neapolitana]
MIPCLKSKCSREEAGLDPKIKKALNISIVEGALAVLINQFFGGPYLTGYFLWMGASSFFIGLFGSIPFLANALQIVTVYFSNRLKTRKQLIVPLMWTARTSITLFALFPLIKHGLFLAYILYFYIQIAGALSVPLWQSWMSDLVPRNMIGSYFGFRNLIHGLVQIPAMFAAGAILDSLGENWKGFSALFFIAGSLGFLNGYFLKIQYEPPYRPREASLGLTKVIGILLKEEHYRNLLLGFALWNFAVGVGTVYINVMLLKEVQFSYLQISVLNAVGMFIGTLFQPFWGKLGDKYGFQYFLKLCLWVHAAVILLWALTPRSFLYVFFLQVIIGIFVTAGTSQLIFYTLMYSVPSSLSAEAFSVFNSLSNLMLFAGSLTSGILVSILENFTLPFEISAIRLTMIISFFLRAFAAYRISRMDLGTPQKVTLVQLVRESFFTGVVPWLRERLNTLNIFKRKR